MAQVINYKIMVNTLHPINVKSGPASEYQTIGTLHPGDTVEATLKNGIWYFIPILSGWAAAQNFKLLKDENSIKVKPANKQKVTVKSEKEKIQDKKNKQLTKKDIIKIYVSSVNDSSNVRANYLTNNMNNVLGLP